MISPVVKLKMVRFHIIPYLSLKQSCNQCDKSFDDTACTRHGSTSLYSDGILVTIEFYSFDCISFIAIKETRFWYSFWLLISIHFFVVVKVITFWFSFWLVLLPHQFYCSQSDPVLVSILTTYLITSNYCSQSDHILVFILISFLLRQCHCSQSDQNLVFIMISFLTTPLLLWSKWSDCCIHPD